MRSEYTDGWGTLTNVLSSRLYQKRANWACQTLLEKGVEPLGALAAHYGGDYDEDMVWYVEDADAKPPARQHLRLFL